MGYTIVSKAVQDARDAELIQAKTDADLLYGTLRELTLALATSPGLIVTPANGFPPAVTVPIPRSARLREAYAVACQRLGMGRRSL